MTFDNENDNKNTNKANTKISVEKSEKTVSEQLKPYVFLCKLYL